MLPLPDTGFPAESGRVGKADVSQVELDLSHILGNVCQQQVKDVKFRTDHAPDESCSSSPPFFFSPKFCIGAIKWEPGKITGRCCSHPGAAVWVTYELDIMLSLDSWFSHVSRAAWT
ncbi:hypothetical protein E5288_WYG012260 [Bos mutus]|uniref:Uncharacterized protein n=1 Tax=Bos mutus TaxID=72004 RepID=A0A6B0RLI9_9CETA|nr:hypothetical protein [Bos mutus]